MKTSDSMRASVRIYLLATVGLTAIAAILGILSILLNYDIGIGYYSHHSVLPVVLTVLCTASVIFFAVFSIFRFRRGASAYAKVPTLAVRITAALAAAVALLLAIADLRSGASLLLLLIGFGTCLYFLLMASNKHTPALSLAFGFCAILRLTLEIARSYTNLLIPMNSPEKIWLHLSAAMGIFFLISELRALITKPYTATFFFAAASATLLCSTASLTILFGILSNRVYGAQTKSETLFAALTLCLALYAGARLFTVARNSRPEDESEKEIDQTIEDPEEN